MKKQNFTNIVKVAIVGVGGGGCNTINYIWENNSFAYLSKVSPKQLADFLANEHSQTIALIAANMDSNSATEMLSYFSDEERADIADKKESIDNISLQIVKRVSNILENKLESLMNCKVEVRKTHIALDTDKMALLNNIVDSNILLGEKTTQGFGAGMNPELGKKSAEESYEAIKSALHDSNIVLITAGLGGGTGTGALPIVARIAKEIGALTIAVATMPFACEGRAREKIAQNGLDEIKNVVDSFFVLPNEKLLSTIDKSMAACDTLKIIDSTMAKALLGLANILSDNNGGLNIDFADLRIAMENKGFGFIGVGDKDGEDSAVEAIKEAMQSPLFDSTKTRGAKCAIIHYTINENYPPQEMAMANEIVQQQLDEDAFCKYGWTWDNTLKPSQLKVTLIITGLKNA